MFGFRRWFLPSLFIPLFWAGTVRAESRDAHDRARFTLHFPPSAAHGALPLAELERTVNEALLSASNDLTEMLQAEPSTRVTVRLLSPEEFHRRTGAPAWTSAMYLRGEISIPLGPRASLPDIQRAVRHEYVHAVLAEFSSRQCPAWLDEGIAQILEGDQNPLLAPALRRWIGANDAMPLDWLHSGFMTLQDENVPVAYAQSLFATQSLLSSAGPAGVKRYLELLRQGTDAESAFSTAFGETPAEFQRQLTAEVRAWAAQGKALP